MPLINQAVIEEIKNRCDIVEFISSYVNLKRAGSNYVGLCPFHSEKTPSFTVFPDTQNFYCFGCGAGGDLINFVRKIENLDYVSSVELLAKRAGITIKASEEEAIAARKRQRTLEMNTIAAKYYNHVLLNTDEGKPGLQYLLSRKLTIPLIRHFGLGFAPANSKELINILRSKGYSTGEMTESYLAKVSANGNVYPLFNNRVIFPIISTSGNVVAFGGRVMDDSKPKYLNSSDTPAFKKSKNLFALNFARKTGSERMILCEGYMDVISLHGAGFSNAVATLGTAITPDQARIFSKYTKNVVICYDSDEAGQRAADKAFTLLGEAGVECKILAVQNAKDPDEYITKNGPSAFKNLLEGSLSEYDYKFEKILSKYDLSDSESKIKALDEVEFLIASSYSSARRDVYISDAAKKFDVKPESIKSDVDMLIRRRQKAEKNEEKKQLLVKTSGYGDRINPDTAKNLRAVRAEEAMLGIILIHPEYLEELEKNGNLPTPDEFFSGFGRKVYNAILDIYHNSVFEESMLGEYLSSDEYDRIIGYKTTRKMLTDNSVEVFAQCRKTLNEASERSGLSLRELVEKKRKELSDSKLSDSINNGGKT